MRWSIAFILILSATAGFAETKAERKARLLAPTTDFSRAEPFEDLQGGSGTNRDRFDRNAFSLPSATLTFEQRSDFFVGNGVFDRPWVAAPASTIGSDGLGPLFNARSCQGCHIKDGRGHPPEPGDTNMVSIIFSLSDANGNPDPVFGNQFQDQAVTGMNAEGRAQVAYEELQFDYLDGSYTMLRRPVFSTETALFEGVAMNPRIAPPMIGLGLIEHVAAADILAYIDPEDADGDGISGRAHLHGDILGRFGWKATAPTVLHQTAAAFSNDMGLSSRIFPADHGDCTAQQPDCREAFHGGDYGGPEVADDLLDLTVFYASNLAVPARRDAEAADVLAGKELFYAAQCTACHVPKFATSPQAPKEHRNQLIWPYSDFLLHDLGPDLADQTPTGEVAASEWRTQPLWGLGLTEAVSGHTYLLHDGRARSIEEAILWHGGEAEAARDAFASFTAQDRALLIRFLESL